MYATITSDISVLKNLMTFIVLYISLQEKTSAS